MTILAAILCRIGGHKPYEHARVEYSPASPSGWATWIWTRCKRCGRGLSKRPYDERDDETIEA